MIGLISFQDAKAYRMEQSVKCSIWIATPRERVWQVLTDAKEMEACLCEYREFTALHVGGMLKFGPEDDAVYALIELLDAPCELLLHHPAQPQYYPVSIFTRYILVDDSGGIASPKASRTARSSVMSPSGVEVPWVLR